MPNVACLSGLSILDCHLVSLSVIMGVRILCTGSKFEFYAPCLGSFLAPDPDFINTLSNTRQ